VTGTARKSLTSSFPLYGSVRHFIRILDGVAYELFRSTRKAIREHCGDYQHPASWKDPETWVPAYRTGSPNALAYRLWRESEYGVNPRLLLGAWNLCVKHALLRRTRRGFLAITEKGESFMDDPDGETVGRIDAHEGVLNLLQTLSQAGRASSGDILRSFTEYCLQETTSRNPVTIKELLRMRLRNLVDRGYVSRSGQDSLLTDAGAEYLERHRQLLEEQQPVPPEEAQHHAGAPRPDGTTPSQEEGVQA